MKLAISAASLVLLVSACGAKKSSSTDESSTNKVEASNLDDLNLSGALAISIPDSVAGKGKAALALLDGSKSKEACEMRQTTSDGLSNLKMLSNMLCMFEQDDNIEFGTKYNLDFGSMAGGGAPGGDESMAPPGMPLTEEGMDFPTSAQLWIDNSVEGTITVYMCQDKKLTDKFVVTGSTSGRAKGEIISAGKMAGVEFGRNIAFDNKFTDKDRTTFTSTDYMKTDSTGFRKYLKLDLADGGVSYIALSKRGSIDSMSFADAAAARIDSTYGSALYTTEDGGARRSFFDGQGNVVEDTASDKFKDGKALFVEDSEVPQLLAKDFKPTGLSSADWDCKTEKDLEVTAPTGKNACEMELPFPDETCSDPNFAEGPKFDGFDDSKRPKVGELKD